MFINAPGSLEIVTKGSGGYDLQVDTKVTAIEAGASDATKKITMDKAATGAGDAEANVTSVNVHW